MRMKGNRLFYVEVVVTFNLQYFFAHVNVSGRFLMYA